MSGQDVMIMGAAVGASFLSLQFQLMVVYDDIQNQVGFRPLQKMISIIQSRYRHILPSSKSCSNYVTTSIIENGNRFCSRTRKMEILFCIGLTAEEVQERKIFYSGLLNRYRSQLEAIQAYF